MWTCVGSVLEDKGALSLNNPHSPIGLSPAEGVIFELTPLAYSNFVMLRSTLGRPAPPVTLGGAYKKNMIVSQILGGTKTIKNKSQTA